MMNHENEQFTKMRWVVFWICSTLYVLLTFATLSVVFFDYGSTTPEERSLLFKLFICEIGAAFIALFYSLFKLQKNNTSKKHDGIFPYSIAHGQKIIKVKSQAENNYEKSWEDILHDIEKLNETLKNGNIQFDYIVSFANGGLIVADLLHTLYRPNAPIISVVVRRYDALPGRSLTLDVEKIFVGKYNWESSSILIIDDVVASGKTISVVSDFFSTSVGIPNEKIFTAVLGIENNTRFIPHHYCFKYKGECILPWGKVPRDLPKFKPVE